MLAGGLVSAAGCALAYGAQSLAVAAVGFSLLVAVGAVGLGPMPTSKLIVDWFPDQPGTALGINAIGPSIGALLAPKLVPPAIGAWGWRGAVAACGVAFAGTIPLVLALAREAKKAAQPAALALGGKAASAPSDMAFLRERNFWVLTAAFGLSIPPLVALGNAYPPYATQTRGLTNDFVGTLLFSSAVVGIAANLVFGRLADRLDRKLLIWIAQAPLIASCALLATTPPIGWLLPMAIVTGLAQGTTALWTASIGDRFAPESFGRVMGTMGLCMLPVTLAAVYVPMWVFGVTHRFEPAFAGFAVVVGLSAVAVLFLRPRRVAA
jgi:MFS family permease